MNLHTVSVFVLVLSPSVLYIEGAGPVKTLAYLVSKKIKDGAIDTIKSTGSDEAVRYFADTLVTTILTSCLKLMPNTLDIPPLDLDINMGGPGHLTADKGKIRGLSSAAAQQIRYAIDENEHLLISMPIAFSDLHVIYDRFVFDCWPLKMTGNADMKFIDNLVIINIKIVKISEMISKIARMDCVFHMKSVTFEGFEQIDPIIKLDSDVGNHDFLTNHVFPVVAAEVKKVLLEMIDVKITNSIHNTLPASSAWLCRDNNLKQLILQNGGPVSFTPEGAASWLSDNVENNVKHLVSNIKDVTTSKIGEVTKNIEGFNIKPDNSNGDISSWVPSYPESIKSIVTKPTETAGILLNSLQENMEALPSWRLANWVTDTQKGAASWLTGGDDNNPPEEMENMMDKWMSDIPGDTQTSQHNKDIQTSKHNEDIQTSKHNEDIQTSKHNKDTQTSEHKEDNQSSEEEVYSDEIEMPDLEVPPFIY